MPNFYNIKDSKNNEISEFPAKITKKSKKLIKPEKYANEQSFIDVRYQQVNNPNEIHRSFSYTQMGISSNRHTFHSEKKELHHIQTSDSQTLTMSSHSIICSSTYSSRYDNYNNVECDHYDNHGNDIYYIGDNKHIDDESFQIENLTNTPRTGYPLIELLPEDSTSPGSGYDSDNRSPRKKNFIDNSKAEHKELKKTFEQDKSLEKKQAKKKPKQDKNTIDSAKPAKNSISKRKKFYQLTLDTVKIIGKAAAVAALDI